MEYLYTMVITNEIVKTHINIIQTIYFFHIIKNLYLL
jgi:hypothetical protein